MENTKIRPQDVMPPHRKQEGIVYIRVCNKSAKEHYDDTLPVSRTISSVRVENAVELADYIKICQEEGLHVAVHPGGGYTVFSPETDNGKFAEGSTLRQAYFRFHKEA